MNKDRNKLVNAEAHYSSDFNKNQLKNIRVGKRPNLVKNISTIFKFFFLKNNRKPAHLLPKQNVSLEHFTTTGSNQLNVTWLGHSSLMTNIDGYKILTDPVFENRISLLGPTRYNGSVPIKISELPNLDLVLITHNHYDHLNKFSIKALNEKVKLFVVPVTIGKILTSWGISSKKIIELNWWQEFKIDDNLLIVFTPTQHFSGRGLFDNNKTLWGSYVVKSRNHKIFFSGDSGYFNGFKQIGDKYGPFDITFIECGAYNELWHTVHMFPEETMQAHIDLKGRILHPIHWGTFNLSLHAWFEPMERISKAAEKNGVTLALPIVGETSVYPQNIPHEKWWKKFI